MLSPEELAFGHGVGIDDATVAAVRAAQRAATPQAPADVLLDSIRTSVVDRCFVEFSGGVDSSLILSAATRVAHERDAPPPVPVTLRYASESTREDEYQERMIEWLGLADWRIIDVDDELDLVGPASMRYLVEHGMTYAPRLAGRDWWLSRLDDADGAVLLNGEGGDEVLATAPLVVVHAARFAARSGRFRRQALRLAAERTRRWIRPPDESALHPRWLTAEGRRAHDRALRRDRRRAVTMKQFLRTYRARRALVADQRRLVEQAARFGLGYVSPLLDIDVMGAFTASIPDHDFINRNLVVRKYFADLLPAEILHRTTKVYFSDAVYNTATREFAERWDGVSGVPTHLADPELVRRTWLDADDARSGLMLQSARLAAGASGAS